MKLARYIGGGEVRIVDEPEPDMPPGGLIVQTEACGLCSGELMDWYMDQKAPHVLGHEVAGIVMQSEDARFPVGSRVYPHHHAPCLECPFCLGGNHVHCAQWKRTKLRPGGMAERFAVAAENLTDTWQVDDLDPRIAALIEPLSCVEKSIRQATLRPGDHCAVIGLGVMGLLHAILLDRVHNLKTLGFDLLDVRRAHALSRGIAVSTSPSPGSEFNAVFVCPGSQSAFDRALAMAAPGAVIVMFAPLPPNEDLRIPSSAYFRDIRIVNSYSAGPRIPSRRSNICAKGLYVPKMSFRTSSRSNSSPKPTNK